MQEVTRRKISKTFIH